MIYVRFNGYGQWRFYEDDVHYRSIPNGQDSYHAKGIFSLIDDDEDDLDWDEESLKNPGSIDLKNQSINMLCPSDHPKSAYSKMACKGEFDSLLKEHSDSEFFKREHRGEFGDDPDEAEDNGDHDKASQLRSALKKAWQVHAEAKAAEFHELAKVALFHVDAKKKYILEPVAKCKPNKIENQFSQTERNKMLTLIIDMAIDAYGYDPNIPKNSATGGKNGISAKILARTGITVDDEIIRKYLNDAVVLLKTKNQLPRKT